jgi:acetyl-CoA acetyltransferase
MTEAVIVDAVRTPGGKRNGKLKDQHPAALAATVLKALEERNGLDPAMVDDVIMGCVMQVGEQSLNIGRSWPPAGPKRCRPPRSTASAARVSSRCTSLRRA